MTTLDATWSATSAPQPPSARLWFYADTTRTQVERGQRMNKRHDARCEFCGRFMSWERWSSWNCFAGFPWAWCHRLECNRREREASSRGYR